MVDFREDRPLILDAFSELLQVFACSLARLVCRVIERVALWILLHLKLVPLFELAESVAAIFAEVELGKVNAMAGKKALIFHPEILLWFLTFILFHDSLSQHTLLIIAPVPFQFREDVSLLIFCLSSGLLLF